MIYASAKAVQNGRAACRGYVTRDDADEMPWRLVVIQEIEGFVPGCPRVFSFDFWDGSTAFGAFAGLVESLDDCEVKHGFGPLAEL